MISKELLSNVLNKNVSYFVVRQNEITYTYDDCDEDLNIYELAHKCKEWAYANNYNIESDYEGYTRLSTVDTSTIVSKGSITIPFELSEPEAVFNDCQWILDNKE